MLIAGQIKEELKICSACETEKQLSEFPADIRRKDGTGSKCHVCVKIITQEYYKKYPEKEAERRARGAISNRKAYRKNRQVRIEKMRWYAVHKKYGVSKEEYQRILEAQNNKCEICLSGDPGRKDGYFSIDHNHMTGKIRGLLCQRCNCAIGFMKDSPERLRKAADYVETRGK